MGQKCGTEKPQGFLIFILVIFVLAYVFLNYHGRSELKRWYSPIFEMKFQEISHHDTEYVEEHYEVMDQFDERLIKYTRARYLIPPNGKPYNFKNPPEPPTENSLWARNFLKNKTNGVFVEAGANEGEIHSHTLSLELSLNWTGLLIECNPLVVPYLRSKNRNAWVAGVCISTQSHPQILNFSNPVEWSYSGRLGPSYNLSLSPHWTQFTVEAVPLYPILEAAGIREIDFFSFDVEGLEFEILKHFPFDKIFIRVIIMEVYFLPHAERVELDAFLATKGYKALLRSNDHYYVHESELE